MRNSANPSGTHPVWLYAFAMLLLATGLHAQTASGLPTTSGERLSGGSVVVAQVTGQQTTILVASFSRDASSATTDWLRTLHSDPAFAGTAIYQLVMLERAPGFVRSLIRSALRRQTPAAWQANTVILTADEAKWRGWFAVSEEREPYVVAMDRSGHVVWHGHGGSTASVASLKAALR
jgi:hypothetical protein